MVVVVTGQRVGAHDPKTGKAAGRTVAAEAPPGFSPDGKLTRAAEVAAAIVAVLKDIRAQCSSGAGFPQGAGGAVPVFGMNRLPMAGSLIFEGLWMEIELLRLKQVQALLFKGDPPPPLRASADEVPSIQLETIRQRDQLYLTAAREKFDQCRNSAFRPIFHIRQDFPDRMRWGKYRQAIKEKRCSGLGKKFPRAVQRGQAG
eukprot:g11218.t1